MKSIFKIFALLILVMLASSCKKDLKETQEKLILLTKPSGWLTLKVEQKSSSGTWVDITGTPNPLDADNLLIFDPWYNWAINEGALKLPDSRQILSSGTWSFLDNNTKIQIKDGNLMEITELSETKLIIVVTANGSTNRYTYGHP